MGKIKESIIDAEDILKNGNKLVVEEVKVPQYTHTALSMAFLPGEGWSLIKVKYNPETGGVGKLEKKYTGEIRAYIEEKFKIETVTEAVFNNCNVKY